MREYKICECCAKSFEPVNNNNIYCCEECKKIMKARKQQEYQKNYLRAPRVKKPKPRAKRKGMTLEQINTEALKAGMSYGKYVALKGL